VHENARARIQPAKEGRKNNEVRKMIKSRIVIVFRTRNRIQPGQWIHPGGKKWPTKIEKSKVSDPDLIRIQSGQWIRIRIWNPDPGGPKWPTKVEKKFRNARARIQLEKGGKHFSSTGTLQVKRWSKKY
jgi:hypothetical protein